MMDLTTHETPKQMFNSFKTLLLDPAGVMGLGGTLILTLTSFLQGVPGYISACAGALLVVISGWQKIQVTRRQNAAEKRRQEAYTKKMEILQMVHMGTMKMEIADFTLRHLDDDK